MSASRQDDAADLGDLLRSIRSGLPDLPPHILEAFAQVPRTHFLPDLPPKMVWQDRAIPIKTTLDGVVVSSSSQPSMIAIMLQQLDLRPGDNIMEIGAGSGYNAALIQHLVGEHGHVTSVEIDAEVAETARANLQRARMTAVSVVTGDGTQGYAPRAAYDRILATAAVWDIPRAWVRQLRPGGRLVLPIALPGVQISAAFTSQRDGALYSADNHVCAFVWMQGQRSPVASHRLGTGLMIEATSPLDSAAVAHLLQHDAETGYLPYTIGTGDLWRGFLPWLALNLLDEAQIVTYHSSGRDYGITGHGFGLIAGGSASFVPLSPIGGVGEKLMVRWFGASESLMLLEGLLHGWAAAGCPDHRRLRLRLIPVEAQPIGTAPGRAFRRREHVLQAWLEG
jgi:protein-L-isoaspartate(D-aspartate) O-methyltransferase